MRALVETVNGVLEIDLDTEELDLGAGEVRTAQVATGLPRVVAAAAAGSTVVAVVESRPPLLVSHDAGRTWREAGRGLPPGFAVAIGQDDPDVILYAGRNRLYVSRDGGRFWRAIPAELPDIVALSLAGA